jgi:hypothetical protein
MDTKLTLRLDKATAERAKEYAKKNKISLSKIIESYLDAMTKGESAKNKITPLVKSLSGVIKLNKDVDVKKDYKDVDVKKDYADYLSDKYQ